MALSIFTVSCEEEKSSAKQNSSANQSEASPEELTAVFELPKAVAPVGPESDSEVKYKLSNLINQAFAAQDTRSFRFYSRKGLNLSKATRKDFNCPPCKDVFHCFDKNWCGNSQVMCKTLNVIRDIYDGASRTDRNLCYLQKAIAQAADKNLKFANILDSKYHVFTINFPNNSRVGKFKLKIEKNADQKIKTFEMFSCFDPTSVGGVTNFVQTEYQKQEISGDNVEMRLKSIINNPVRDTGCCGEKPSHHLASIITVKGTIHDNHSFSSKVMEARIREDFFSYSWVSKSALPRNQINHNYIEAEMRQYSDSIILRPNYTFLVKGRTNYDERPGDMRRDDYIFEKIQLIDKNADKSHYDLRKLFIGSGSSKRIPRAISRGNYFLAGDEVYSEHWQGDTMKTLYDGDIPEDYLKVVTDGEFLERSNELENDNWDRTDFMSISFSKSKQNNEVWDCSDANEFTINLTIESYEDCSKYSMRDVGDYTPSWAGKCGG